MEKLEMTCIRCPMGCQLRAELDKGAVISVSGNTCKRGEDYARTEAVAPTRTVTSTVAVRGGIRPVVAVKTVPEVPKSRIFDVMACVRALRVDAPVQAGAVLLQNVCGTGADVIATAELPEK